jgi:putative membrane protein
MNRETHPSTQAKDGPVLTVVKGFLVGIANIIPGVSGGTFALILGIFDRIIGALNSLNAGTIKVVLGLITKGFNRESGADLVAEWKRLDATFLVLLMFGAGAAIYSSSFLIDYLLRHHYSPTLAFFIGLILPSIAIPWAMMERRGAVLLFVLPGIALTVGVSFVMPDSSAGMDNLAMAFGTGAIAISAMILPGISGSYVMLVMGQYQNVLNKLTHIDGAALIWFAALALGMGVGIILFARLLHFLLARFRSATMAFLIGLLVGSLWVLWPFKAVEEGAAVTDRSGEVKEEVRIATAPNRLPGNATEGLAAGGAFIAGIIGSAGLLVIGRRRKGDN